VSWPTAEKEFEEQLRAWTSLEKLCGKAYCDPLLRGRRKMGGELNSRKNSHFWSKGRKRVINRKARMPMGKMLR